MENRSATRSGNRRHDQSKLRLNTKQSKLI